MTGREKHKKYQIIIGMTVRVATHAPRFLRRLLWDFSRPYAGSISVLLRYSLLAADAKRLGKNVYIGRNVTISNAQALVVGDNVSIHDNCYIDAIGGCSIGNNVSIAHACSILTFDHTWEDEMVPIKYNKTVLSSVSIEDDVWVGAGVRILRGSKVGERVVVAAGAVVRSTLATNAVYGGVPARKIRDI